MTGALADKSASRNASAAQAWARALELTAPIASHPHRILPAVIEERAAQSGNAPALISERESLSYDALTKRVNQYARWSLAQGIGKGECVGLLMPNRPEFLAIWLGITQAGGVAALLNTNLTGASLAHCIHLVAPKHLIVDQELADSLATALPHLATRATVWVHGASHELFRRMEPEIEQHSSERLSEREQRTVTIDDRALYIYTSGTTGLPKAAAISHGRVMQWSHWFAGMMGTQATDRMYDCLPMYHSVGGVQAPGALLASGGAVVLGEKFSARRFWSDIVRWDCTMFQYIGELCRYLLHAEPPAGEAEHQIRLACGNGLRPDIWESFQKRFRIPQILEFYAATEGNVSLFNAEGEPGAIGRIPRYLAHRFPAALVRFDIEKNEPVRNEQGFCIRCGESETGEAIGQMLQDSSKIGSRFEGYTDREASEKKILRDVFTPGDAWYRTGDLMRRDERGFFYFVDRIGDTFRWKGENVATSEVAEVISAFPGVKEANVYGVAIPGTDGRAGMAAIVAGPALDLAGFREHLTGCLPHYARPLFLRIGNEIEVTGTFKHTKTELVRQGYDPAATADALYFNHPEEQAFVRVDQALFERIQAGQVRL